MPSDLDTCGPNSEATEAWIVPWGAPCPAAMRCIWIRGHVGSVGVAVRYHTTSAIAGAVWPVPKARLVRSGTPDGLDWHDRRVCGVPSVRRSEVPNIGRRQPDGRASWHEPALQLSSSTSFDRLA